MPNSRGPNEILDDIVLALLSEKEFPCHLSLTKKVNEHENSTLICIIKQIQHVSKAVIFNSFSGKML